jgi:mono/diheme cytochrome c family protein
LAKRILLALLVAAAVVAAGAAGFVYSGIYDIAATDQHTAPVFWLLKTTMRRAVQHQARGIDVPPLDDPALIAQGRALFVANCSRCHGAPGVAPEPFALGFRPAPANLANTGLEWKPAELYWTIKHGMKLTAMPAWEYRLPDRDLWAIVAYVQRLPYESPRAFREALRASAAAPQPSPARMDAATAAGASAKRLAPAADPERGRHVLLQYGCLTCHEIPGVVGAAIPVGPPLDRMGSRRFIAGVLENTPANMVRWIRAPEQFVPDGAMPNLGVPERDAADMAAYLESLR